MNDITHKTKTLRKAVASALVLVSKTETLEAIRNRKVPKGDVFEFSRAAGLLAVKKTADMIPDCHPIPVEYTSIRHELQEKAIRIIVEVQAIYRTGVEVEAMHGAAIAALTIYDMLKPIDSRLEISQIRLEYKEGGKSDFRSGSWENLEAGVVVCSDSVSEGKKEDLSGKAIIRKLADYGISNPEYRIIRDDLDQIRSTALELCKAGKHLVLFTGGTGLFTRDNTPDALMDLFDKEIPGIMETARQYGQERTPYAMLSRGVSGFIGNTLVLALPGSSKGALESLEALFPYVFHVFQVRKGVSHDEI